MATKTISWSTGTGSVTATYTGSGNGTIQISSDPNSLYENRSMQITVKTTDNSISKTITVSQAAKSRIDISTATVTASNQTYSGSAKTPTPTVTLNGTTIPSTGYDVAYSNNTNAGTATITVTGKGAYTGTATGSFTINKASRTLSFAVTYAVVAPSGNITKTATPSGGSGDGAITYSISSTTYATINSSSGKVTAKTSDGSAIVTATIAEGTNYLSATASYNLYVFATTHNYDYNGSYRDVTLPPGTYQFQCWGAQGGSNAADSSYGITTQAGGKGGYSVGQLTISQDTNIRVYVGGQGNSSGTAGFNGGGSVSGHVSSNNDARIIEGRNASGGGGTDIRLYDGSLYSRMIVAGGGSGGASCYRADKNYITPSTSKCYLWAEDLQNGLSLQNSNNYTMYVYDVSNHSNIHIYCPPFSNSSTFHPIVFTDEMVSMSGYKTSGYSIVNYTANVSNAYNNYISVPSGMKYLYITVRSAVTSATPNVYYLTEATTSQAGYFGGGTTGDGFNGDYKGKQNAAGTNASFGQGGSNSVATKVCASGGGGGGWYGGGDWYSIDLVSTQKSGGGSGFVNTAASAGNRPSGYTGLQLDSGSTTAGNSSFPAPSGGNETGHAGNGYARITRLS